MSNNAAAYQKEFFNVSFPAEYVAHVEINRPEKLNAFKEVMWHNLSAIFRALSHDPSVRAVLLTGAGPRAFTAGLDVQAASQEGALAQKSDSDSPQDSARKATTIRRHILEFQSCITDLEKCEKPVIAVLHGISFGLALDMCLACDIRVATADAKISVKEVDIGIAADIGTLSRLPHSVGNLSWVKDVALSARIFGAEEALRVGLVSSVYKNKDEAVDQALKLASLIASKSPVATLGTKDIINYSRDKTVAEGLHYTAVWNAAMLQTQDVQAAMLSGMQKRTPKFSKL
ncbi:delta-delta-dienoyl-CoA isomeras-like protein [Cucurbitaria berberidis CBS 394.84]|uniref:Delta-delta-dienoyl-CoA isomeras-like protein n=1 Tax=Cucurbitaria berberidis CBS 394.84 TaxID=1168544 RepID=A0A9P4GGG3_9PLEO|nr:delta-delta-dienoyl-CoA isomeras-like protein [Cucurbitaria berberidis CBS 394.84]KAF1844994.1 delta-delta-dienoyl-CoA isomeras-like protein [Cucurbitaria berberidis CBS 394.84]